ncbi:related to F-box protein pof7 [Ustilago trichophora]|uniref:Related to F-box protein pof7 n=1 Tax=Ustilago trichophora TaxID=86804 RepID=A0A5C3E3Q1_9BASI|nr:related to F-box protein pof7 [Ustilago trichophora]
MDQRNTVPLIPPHAAVAAAEDDAVEGSSGPSTPFAGQSGAQTPLEASNGSLTPQRPLLVNDELERFRSEWKKEVESRGYATYAQPPAAASSALASTSNPAQVKHTRTPNAHQALSSKATQNTQPGVDAATNAADSNGQDDEQADEDQDLSLHSEDSSLPFPEAEIYAPAAFKYSKGAHKIPRPDTQQPRHDLPAPLIAAEYHPPPLSSSGHVDGTPLSPTSSAANGVSHALRDRIRASAAPNSSGTSPSRTLAPKQQIPTDAEASGPSSTPAPSRAPRIMATPNAPANASEATQAGMRSAVEAYVHAVEMERSGQLDEALLSYRRAFKLNSNADRLYHRAHLLLTDPALANTSTQQNDALLSSPAIADKVRKALDFDDHRYVAIKERQVKEAEARARGETYDGPETKQATTAGAEAQAGEKPMKLTESRPDELARLLDSLSIEGGGERDFGMVTFQPEDEEKEMPIARLPDEVLLHILRMVIAPRGRRGAKVVKPKPTPEEQAAMEAATAALTGRGAKTTAAKIEAQKANKAGASVNGVKADGAVPLPSTGSKEEPATSVEASASTGKTDREKAPESSVGVLMRKQPLGIGVVLGGADWQSLEILGRTCWKFRLLTKSPSLWREIVRETYYPPILDPTLTLSTLYERHHSDWRTAFINQPRVRLNGCYIAACHYARPGLSEDAWVRVIHVVEFYRSIRFLPDGTALSLLTTDPPSETVRKLEPALKAKGFSRGRWELFEEGLEDDEEEGRPRGPKVVVEDLRDKSMQKYAFRMVFGLRSTTRGRWNKLDLLEYYSVNLTNGEVLPLPQKHSRPFHFSRVIAYGV